MFDFLQRLLLHSTVGPAFDLSAFKDGLEVIVPQPLTIRVPITGYPIPAAKWTFREKELTAADERVTLTTKSTFVELMVTPSVRPDRGTYTLQLENDVTSVSGEIEVNVIGVLRKTLSSNPPASNRQAVFLHLTLIAVFAFFSCA